MSSLGRGGANNTAQPKQPPLLQVCLSAIVAASAAGCSALPRVVQRAAPDAIVAVGEFARPAISLGRNGTVFVAAEGAGMASVHLFTWTGRAWGGRLVAASERGGVVDASRVYCPDVEAVGETCVVAMRCGNKEWGSLRGPAYATGSGVWRFPDLTEGAARLAVDPARPNEAVLMTKNGAFGVINERGDIFATGAFGAGQTGEKYAFCIDAASRWHTAMNGFSGEASAYARTGIRRRTWASHEAYPEQGDDLRYPSVVADGESAVIATVLGGRLRVQIMDAGEARFPIDDLPSLGAATMEERCPPKLVATPRGVVAVWRAGGAIMAANVKLCLDGSAKPVRIAEGAFPDAACGPDGMLHVVYSDRVALNHKKVEAP